MLIETMVAMLIGAIMALAIVALLAQSLRISSATSNQMAADQIANSVFETIRQYNFATIKSFNGQAIPLNINSAAAPPSVEPVPLGIYSGSLNWTALSLGNAFPGTATLLINPGPVPNTTVLAVVSVQWVDSSKMQTHTATYSTVICAGGEDYWY
jgi:hypothetical protein